MCIKQSQFQESTKRRSQVITLTASLNRIRLCTRKRNQQLCPFRPLPSVTIAHHQSVDSPGLYFDTFCIQASCNHSDLSFLLSANPQIKDDVLVPWWEHHGIPLKTMYTSSMVHKGLKRAWLWVSLLCTWRDSSQCALGANLTHTKLR